MDRALWVVVGKVASLMLLGSLVSLSRSGVLAVAIGGLALAAYAVSMTNLLRSPSDAPPVAAEVRRAGDGGYVTDGGRWAREP